MVRAAAALFLDRGGVREAPRPDRARATAAGRAGDDHDGRRDRLRHRARCRRPRRDGRRRRSLDQSHASDRGPLGDHGRAARPLRHRGDPVVVSGRSSRPTPRPSTPERARRRFSWARSPWRSGRWRRDRWRRSSSHSSSARGCGGSGASHAPSSSRAPPHLPAAARSFSSSCCRGSWPRRCASVPTPSAS